MKLSDNGSLCLNVAAAAILCIPTTGCSLGLMEPIVVEGESFLVERAVQLRAGMSQPEVEALLGPARQRVTGAQAVMWSYSFERRIRECRPYLGSMPLRRARSERHALELTFHGNALIHAIYRQHSSNRSTQQVIVGIGKNAG